MDGRTLLLGSLVVGLLAGSLWNVHIDTPFCRPIEPVHYTVPPNPGFEGVFAHNEGLLSARRLAEGKVRGCESLAFPPNPDGFVYSATEDGWIIRVTLDGSQVEKVGYVGGRPLGLAFDPSGEHIYLADVAKGLISFAMKTKTVQVLSSASSDGQDIVYADDLAVAADGTVFFSDASSICVWRSPSHTYDTMTVSKIEGLEARRTGRLLKWDPKSGRTTVLMSDLYFANGVALARDESFVLVVETFDCCVTKYWLKGERAGHSERCIEYYPGYLDGISTAPNGNFWVTMYAGRNPLVGYLGPFTNLRLLLIMKFRSFLPKPAMEGAVFELDSTGMVVRGLHDTKGAVAPNPTSAVEHNGQLFVGNLKNTYINVLPLNRTSS